jgi:hypothetical protein
LYNSSLSKNNGLRIKNQASRLTIENAFHILLIKMAGYSSTPLAKKLGIKSNFKIRLINAPEYYFNLFTDLPNAVKVVIDKKIKKNFIHLFVKNLSALEQNIYTIKNEIEEDGIIWVSWFL